jgi:cytochrome c5
VHDKGQSFIDTFTLIMGIVLGLVVGAAFMLRMTVLEQGTAMALEDPAMREAVTARLEPIGAVVLLGDEALRAAPPPPVTPARVATVLSGPQVYNEACNLCHAAPGIGGAPVFGDEAAWSGRIAQGVDTLIQHAINGFQGATGVMPPKGGRVDLSDEEIGSAVQFMVDEATADSAQ